MVVGDGCSRCVVAVQLCIQMHGQKMRHASDAMGPRFEHAKFSAARMANGDQLGCGFAGWVAHVSASVVESHRTCRVVGGQRSTVAATVLIVRSSSHRLRRTHGRSAQRFHDVLECFELWSDQADLLARCSLPTAQGMSRGVSPSKEL